MLTAKVMEYFVQNLRRLFMLDAWGAALTAFAIGIVMPALPVLFNVPGQLSYALSGIAVFFALYSTACGLLLNSGYRPYLLAIASANFAYCLATAAILVKHFYQFSVYTNIYFVLEIIVIILLIYIELMVFKRLLKQLTVK